METEDKYELNLNDSYQSFQSNNSTNKGMRAMNL